MVLCENENFLITNYTALWEHVIYLCTLVGQSNETEMSGRERKREEEREKQERETANSQSNPKTLLIRD